MAEKEFLKRWSETKLAEEKPPEVIPDAPESNDGELEETPPVDLPSIDSLDGDSDYTPFLGEGVPEELARKALRKLWSSDPAFANLDGLNDYDDDYSKLGIVDTVVNTIYEIGKGIVAEEDKMEEEEEPQADDESESIPEADFPDGEIT